jgi:Glycosyltransferase family 17
VKVWSTFLFSGLGTELDMLECHLMELDSTYVYMHVIVEGTRTFQGTPKPLHFIEHSERFAPWADRIVYIAHDPSDQVPGKEPGAHWAREHSSRMATWQGLAGAEPGDIIIHGDVDEIPTPAAIASLVEHQDDLKPCKLLARWANFAVDWLMPPEYPWTAPSVMRYGQVWNMTQLRENGWPVYPWLQPASWHLTWLGGPDAIAEKVASFSHPEAVSWIEPGNAAGKWYQQGINWAASDRPELQQLAVDVDPTWPLYIWQSWDPLARRRFPGGPAPAVWFRPRPDSRTSAGWFT